MDEDQYWEDVDIGSSLKLPIGIVRHETLTEYLPYFEDVGEHASIAEEFAENRIVGFFDQNDVVHVLAAPDVRMSDMLKFFGDAVGETNEGAAWGEVALASWRLSILALDLA